MKKTVLIMAGGRGERFWPRSRKNMPKQFLSLTEDRKTMIQLTIARILPIVSIEDIFVVTNRDYKRLIQEQLPDLPQENILCEPVGRNTAPCIGLAAIFLDQKYEDALMIVLPSDHLIRYDRMFLSSIEDACAIAEIGNHLVTIGIAPDYPETEYGYMRFDPEKVEGRGFAVEKVVEKPDLETAKKYLKTEQYLWNSGMFVWKVSAILKNLEEKMPDTYQGLLKIQKAIGTSEEEHILEQEYSKFKSESIDYGIMEKAQEIYVVPGSFGWDDVGSWLSVGRIRMGNEYGNVVEGNIITINSQNCIIEGTQKLIAAVGLENIIIVDSQDAILICDKNSTGDIKKVLENLKICNRNEYI